MLANWMFFWNSADWVQAPPPPVVNTNPESWGSKSKERNIPGWKVDPWLETDRASQDYWDVRERYIRRYMTPVLEKEAVQEVKIRQSRPIKENEGNPEVTAGQSHLQLLQQARDAVVERARTATNVEALQREVQRVIKLTLDISALRVQYYERAVIILLLDLF